MRKIIITSEKFVHLTYLILIRNQLNICTLLGLYIYNDSNDLIIHITYAKKNKDKY